MGILPTKIGFSANGEGGGHHHESFYCSADILGFLMAIGMARIRWPFAIPKRYERGDGANHDDRRFQRVRIQRNTAGDPIGGELQAQNNQTDAKAAPCGFYR